MVIYTQGEAECYTMQWKFLAGQNFGKFGDLIWIRQIFIRQLLVLSEKARGWA